MLFAHKKTKQGIRSQFCKENIKKSQAVLAFDDQNILANTNVQILENFLKSSTGATKVEQIPSQGASAELQTIPNPSNIFPRIDIQSKMFKVTTGQHGYPRIVKITEIVIGDKILRLSDMFTTLPKKVDDATSSMIDSNDNNLDMQAFSLYFNKKDIPAGVLERIELENKEANHDSEEEKKIVEEIDTQGGNSHQNRFFTLAGTPDAGPIQRKDSFGSKRGCVLEEETDPNIKKRSDYNLLRKKISKQAKKSAYVRKDVNNRLEERIFL